MSDNNEIEFCTKYEANRKIWETEYEDAYEDRGDISIGQIIFEQLHKEPKKICQISDSENTFISKEVMLHNAIRCASFLMEEGITQQDIVGLIARNTTHVTPLVYGCFFQGIAYHALNPGYSEDTVSKLFALTKPKIIFCDAEDYEKIQRVTKSLDTVVITMQAHKVGVPSILDILHTPYDEDYVPAKLEHGFSQTLAILCSSGTTGIPKAVTLTNSHKIFASHSIRSNDVQFCASTMDWLSGLIITTTSGVNGTLRIITDEPFSPTTLLRLVQKYKITWLFHAPTHVALLLNSKDILPEKLDTVRHLLCAGGNLTVPRQLQMQSYLRNGLLLMVYGLTESGSTVSINYRVLHKPGSVGRPVGGYQLRIIDEANNSLGPNQHGEVLCSNGQLWSGYYGNDAETRNMRDPQGWIHTGDIGYIDDDHYLFIIDRKKDMLKYKNLMYYPAEIEEVIAKMPNVSEVCVFGKWNELEGDAAAAAVVKNTSIGTDLKPSEVREFVIQHIPETYKHLQGGVYVVEELKKSPNGKLNRRAVKEHCLSKEFTSTS